jgi:hypothetical protein
MKLRLNWWIDVDPSKFRRTLSNQPGFQQPITRPPPFVDVVLSQQLASCLTGHPRSPYTHAEGSTNVTFVQEPVESV